MTLDPLLEKNREEIIRIASKHGATNLRVYGAFSRGNPGPDSEVELLMDVGPVTTPWFPGGLMEDLRELLGRMVYAAEPEWMPCYFRDRALKEAVPL